MILTLEHATIINDELAFAFKDGFEGYIKLPMLRRACPCAACQGEPDAMGRVLKPIVEYGARAFEMIKFEVVGGYAIQFFWGDNHSTGIYSHAYLKKLSIL